MASPFQTKLPPWVVNSGQQAAWKAANPATQKDWMKHPAWRPTGQQFNASAPWGTTPAPTNYTFDSGLVPSAAAGFEHDAYSGLTLHSPGTDIFANQRGTPTAGIPGTVVSETPEQVTARLARQRLPFGLVGAKGTLTSKTMSAPNPAGAVNAAAFNAVGGSAQTPWFQNPWGAGSKSREMPYYAGGYGRG